MNRFAYPTSNDELAGCCDCGLVASHERLHFDGDEYRCEDCYREFLEVKKEQQQEESSDE